MADRTTLGFVGFVFGGITAAVILMAATVVLTHANDARGEPNSAVVEIQR